MTETLPSRYPDLFAESVTRWGGATITYRFELGMPPAELIANATVAAFEGDDLILVRSVEYGWHLPGGTLEPGESIEACIERELLEEAGARLGGAIAWLGAFHLHTSSPTPYRPHLPHPRFCRVAGWCDAAILGPPQIPADDTETIVEARAMELAEAVDVLTGEDRAVVGSFLRLAADARAAQRTG